MTWARDFLHRFHRHYWKDTLWNRYYAAMEQRCDCGESRHIIEWKDIDMSGGYPGVTRWRAGRHPLSLQADDAWTDVKQTLEATQ